MEPTPRALRKKRLRRVLWVVLGLVGVPVLLVAGVLLFLQTEAGSAFLKKQALSILGNTLAGKLDFDEVELHGGHVVLKNAKLFTPEGELVARVGLLDAWVDLGALTRKTVKVTRVTLDEPELHLVSDDQGLNLLRAVAAKHPAPPDEGPSTPLTWTIDVDALTVSRGFVDLQLPDRRITAEHLGLTGEAKVNLGPLEIGGELALDADVTAPLKEKLTLRTVASAASGPQAYDLDVTLGETKLQGRLQMAPLALELKQLVAAPQELKAFVPGWPLRQAVYAKGTASLERANLELHAGSAQVTVQGEYDLEASSAKTLAVHAKGVDLHELLGAEQSSDLALDLDGSLSSWKPDTLTGKLNLDATWDAKGQRLAAVKADADAKDGTVTFHPLTVTSPGVSLRATGGASLETANLTASLEATDLSRLGLTLKRFANLDVGGLTGNGHLALTAHGPLRHLTAKAVGRFEQLQVATAQATEVDVDADVPDIMRPLETDTLVHARQLKLGDRAFDEVTLDFYSAGRKLDLDLSTKGLGDLKVHVIGRIDDDSQGADLDQLELTWTDSKWVLQSPTRVTWGSTLEVKPFVLAEGTHHLSGQLKKTPSKLDATVHVDGLDLARLPVAFVSPEWKLAGSVQNLDATVSGRASNPDAQLSLVLADAAAFGITHVNATVDGSWVNQRAKGSLDVRTDLGSVKGTFDVPVLALVRQTAGESTAHLEFGGIDTATLEQQLNLNLPVVGKASGSFDLTGDAKAPKLLLSVVSPQVDVKLSDAPDDVLPLTQVQLLVQTDDQAQLVAAFDFRALGGAHHFGLHTPLTLAGLRAKPPTRDSLLDLAGTADVSLRNVALRQAAKTFHLDPEHAGGTVSLVGQLKGPARDLTGGLTLTLADASYPPVQHVNGEVALRAERDQVAVTGHASVENTPALELTASLGTSLGVPLDVILDAKPPTPGEEDEAAERRTDALLAAVKTAPLKVLLQLRPFGLGRVIVPDDGGTAPGGTLQASLEVKGTLDAPDVRLLGSATDLRFDKVALDRADFDLKSAGGRQTLSLSLGNGGRQDLVIDGTTGLALGLSSMREGLAWKEAPVDLTATAHGFDIAFLSGISSSVRSLSGTLDLDAKVTGKLGLPSLVGDVKLQKGGVALASLGEYHDVNVELHGTNSLVELKKLEATAGTGTASLTARGERQSSGAWSLTSKGEFKTFPIVSDDQLLATASLHYELEGEATTKLINIRRLSLPRVDVDLPDVKRKDLQDLQRPGDIVVLRNGMTMAQRRRRIEKAAEAAKKGESLAIRIIIDAQRNLWVHSTDANIEAGLSEGFRVEVDDGVRLSGEARVLRGKLSVIGRAFDVQAGSSVRFNGSPTQPYINVAAVHVNEREQVKITVTVAGKGTDVTIKATSEPPMSESDIYAVLATGRRNLQAGGGASITPGAAASVVGQLATSQLKTAISKKLPLDVFNFETSDKLDQFKLDVGKYLSDTVYIGYTANIGARRERGENVNAGRLEWQMTRSVSLEVYAGDALAFGADAVWTRDF